MSDETFLLTGAMGCIGSWAIRTLLDEGVRVVATDLSEDRIRPRLIMSPAELDRVEWLRLDVTDTAAVAAAVADNGVNRIVHLAGLQVPFARANPPLGAAVNVLGTVNILEAARQHGVRGLAYASSIAVLGPASHYPPGPVGDDAERAPDTLYGVYKTANEECARIYWQDWQLGSIGLRPGVVFGPGRDQGMSADIAKAILAAAAGRPFHIRFGGTVALQHASDTARMFIGCARAEHRGAAHFNLRNDVVDVGEFVALLRDIVPGAAITWDADAPLPIPADFDDSGLRGVLGEVPHTPLRSAVESDVETYRRLVAEDRIDMTQLDR